MTSPLAQRVRTLHEDLIPPAAQALIREWSQMQEQLGYHPMLAVRDAKIVDAVRTRPPGMELPNLVASVLSIPSARELAALHAGLALLAKAASEGQFANESATDWQLIEAAMDELRKQRG